MRGRLMGLVAMALAGALGCSSEATGTVSDEIGATGPRMRAGENCLRCHSTPGKYDAPPWAAGGTIYAAKDAAADAGVAGVEVQITDATGKRVTATTNDVGNFWIAEPLAKPYRVAIVRDGRRKEMPIEAPAGSCNACHSWPDPVGDAPGRIFAP